jgi:1-acyl-sn-glycerol-3-phosphate acyltransferase
MLLFRLTRVILHLFSGLLTCALIFPFADNAGRARRIKRWSTQLLSICRVQVELTQHGSQQTGLHAFIVANHVSWLDIFVIDSIYPSRFVAKSDIRDWPLIGWLCAVAGTIFISRGRMRDVRRIFHDLVVSLQNGEHVAFFPEGTTASQGALLPFHANLFEAAIDAKVPVQPYALRYLDAQGRFHPTVDFVGDMTFAESMLAILRGDKIFAQLIVLPLIETSGAHRRELAKSAHDAIALALGHDIEQQEIKSAVSV